ncbi:hypothetical protein AB1N83_004822 [Pleurotus pulmonarius]
MINPDRVISLCFTWAVSWLAHCGCSGQNSVMTMTQLYGAVADLPWPETLCKTTLIFGRLGLGFDLSRTPYIHI